MNTSGELVTVDDGLLVRIDKDQHRFKIGVIEKLPVFLQVA